MRRQRIRKPQSEKASQENKNIGFEKFGKKLSYSVNSINECKSKETSKSIDRLSGAYLGMSALHHACEACQVRSNKVST